MQVSLWVLFGIIQLYVNYNFIVQDKVSILRTKKELIARFVKDSQNGLYIRSPYANTVTADSIIVEESIKNIKVEPSQPKEEPKKEEPPKEETAPTSEEKEKTVE